jgi:hypothetical protein
MRRALATAFRAFAGIRTLGPHSQVPVAARTALLAALAAPAILGLPACLVASEPPFVGGYATVYASAVPADIYAYPHVWYEGGYAYLVGERWYYPSSGGWVVLRGEPAPLFRFRQVYGYRGAPAYGTTLRQTAPPAPPVYRPAFPPPAERVR